MSVVEEPQFWLAIGILIKNYHALNKKIFEVVITQVQKQQDDQLCDSTQEELERALREQPERRTCKGFTIGFKLLPKKLKDNILATGFVDFQECSYKCQFATDLFEDFSVRLKGGQLELDSHQTGWQEFVLKSKLLSWSQSKPDETKVKSLGLVNVEKYNDLYKELKQKHSQRLLQYWQTAEESTDPLKFIYEDLAIAAYLIVLWGQTQTEPKAFADLGCGNGLLVHILHAEGYKGYGYDIRKRKLWSLYPEDTSRNLIEQAVEPNSFRLDFPEIDWLIGNHSDELSPWLPVLAGRLSTNFFLLPCCPFELSGAKFQRRNTSISAYQDFFHYVLKVAEQCGFETLQDRLKIPSTKRLALLGLKRTTGDTQTLEYFVREELQKYKIGDPKDEMITIKLREKEERVRNCTQVDRSIIDGLVLKIFRLLLASHEDSWSGRLSMRDIAQTLSKEELTGIKSECGGIKTLLRNKHEVFQFCGGDLVGIRKPQATAVPTPRLTTKKRDCFFKLHHPLGCPLDDAECTFIH
ncbi:probable tRNA (uracil-O(2)-)-methyltransferase [Drosophila subobscura]|uniref:probable tRNA (uracil-O(2)-)-methyltransferase n=1 Tax=Drosophila subobscura TaxID=7241 RepID=UPI00155A8A19|nr:probable tRNA (uracil-O(2)-)-methyltransferase [Drosophila subobscura]